jgi:hypothetical protein
MASETAPFDTPDPAVKSLEPSAGWLSTVTYRSRTVAPMSELELYRLLRAAQQRNHEEGVTGVMVYDGGWIFQQLEGPPAGLTRIWDSIRRDQRHGQIEVLGDAPARDRRFADWDLKLSVHGAGAGQALRAWSEPPPELISQLYRGEQQAHLLPTGWLESFKEPASASAVERVVSSVALARTTLASLIHQVVVPRLLHAHPETTPPLQSLETKLLARLLVAHDQQAAFAWVAAAYADQGSLATLARRVVEPAARSLGDLWQSDDCSELEVTLGLMRLQSFVRHLHADTPRQPPLRRPMVLVVPQPGELHMLGAALDAELLWRAGWNPRVEFPASSDALDALVASTWVDALDLSMSTAFRREHKLAQLGETIAHARVASLNPDLVVVVSGRVFGSHDDIASTDAAAAHTGAPTAVQVGVGADASFASSSQVESTIEHALRVSARGRPSNS